MAMLVVKPTSPIVLAGQIKALPFAIGMLLGFVRDLPVAIEKAARIDAAGLAWILADIVLPVMAPGIAAAGRPTVFQRTPNYSVPACNHPLDDAFRARIRGERGALKALMRSNTNGHPSRIAEVDTFSVTPEERHAGDEQSWQRGGLSSRATFRDTMLDRAANDEAAAFISAKIRGVAQGCATAEALTAFDHPFAAKRPPAAVGGGSPRPGEEGRAPGSASPSPGSRTSSPSPARAALGAHQHAGRDRAARGMDRRRNLLGAAARPPHDGSEGGSRPRRGPRMSPRRPAPRSTPRRRVPGISART